MEHRKEAGREKDRRGRDLAQLREWRANQAAIHGCNMGSVLGDNLDLQV